MYEVSVDSVKKSSDGSLKSSVTVTIGLLSPVRECENVLRRLARGIGLAILATDRQFFLVSEIDDETLARYRSEVEIRVKKSNPNMSPKLLDKVTEGKYEAYVRSQAIEYMTIIDANDELPSFPDGATIRDAIKVVSDFLGSGLKVSYARVI